MYPEIAATYTLENQIDVVLVLLHVSGFGHRGSQPTEGLHESLMSLEGSSYQGFRGVCLTWLCNILQRAGLDTYWVLVRDTMILQIYSI
jgi:hypothetical protein